MVLFLRSERYYRQVISTGFLESKDDHSKKTLESICHLIRQEFSGGFMFTCNYPWRIHPSSWCQVLKLNLHVLFLLFKFNLATYYTGLKEFTKKFKDWKHLLSTRFFCSTLPLYNLISILVRDTSEISRDECHFFFLFKSIRKSNTIWIIVRP